MTFILISGKTGVGKTHVCKKVRDLLDLNSTFSPLGRQPSQSGNWGDFIAHYEKGGNHIVLNSPSDTDKCMIDLCQFLDGLAVRPDIIITTIRETDVHHYQMRKMLALLEAAANNTQNLVAHFNNSIVPNALSNQAFTPTALSNHAFVLHLERQQVSGSDEEQAKALALYWDENADKVKYMLDFALARLA